MLGVPSRVRVFVVNRAQGFFATRTRRYKGHLALVYLQQKRLAEARDAFHKALKLNPTNQSASYNLGLIALMQERPAEALPHFEKAHQADPSNVAALIGLLESQLLLKRRD